MGTIADKLLYLGETKADLRATLNDLFGLSLDESTPFRHYANEVDMARVREMFANGELGGYWEPSLETMFVESNGTGAASVGAVVGYYANLIPGAPVAIQATTANKPYLRQTTQTKRYWLDGNTATANLTVTFPESLGSACTIATLDPELGVQWLENQTIGTTRNLITPYAYHGPTLIINRALTAAEKAIVERVMLRKAPELGPELYANPSFDMDAVWTKGVGWSIASGKATKEYLNGAGQAITQQIDFVAGKIYRVYIDIESSVGYGGAGIKPIHSVPINMDTSTTAGVLPGKTRRAHVASASGSYATGPRSVSTSGGVITETSLREIL